MSSATRVKERIEDQAGITPRWRWYHGVAFYVIVQALTFGLSGLTSLVSGNRGKNLRDDFFGDVDYFRELKQSVFSPPTQVFAPAWTLNNISVIIGTWRVLNMPKNVTGRQAFLIAQAISWLNYTLFNAAYFSLRSPINAFILTLSMFVLTIVSGFIAIFRLRDTRVALSLATLFIWLLIALTAGGFQAAWNYDDLYHAGPFFKVNQKLLKQAQ